MSQIIPKKDEQKVLRNNITPEFFKQEPYLAMRFKIVLKEMADYSIFISADEDLLRERLIDRKIKSGNSREIAEKFVDYSDMANVRLCLNKSVRADLMLAFDKTGIRKA